MYVGSMKGDLRPMDYESDSDKEEEEEDQTVGSDTQQHQRCVFMYIIHVMEVFLFPFLLLFFPVFS